MTNFKEPSEDPDYRRIIFEAGSPVKKGDIMRKFFRTIEDWIFDDSIILYFIKVGLVLTVLISPFYFLFSRQKDTEFERCMDSGGAWMVTGSHTQHGFIMSGKVMVPTQQTVREYGCVSLVKP
jgi:hypothetical protein